VNNEARCPTNRIYVASSRNKGRGVYTSKRIYRHDIVEVCPVIPLTVEEVKHVDMSVLKWHLFMWPADGERYWKDKWTGSCMTLGYGSVYNHSADPNMKWYARRSTNEIVFYAIRDIKPGEELTHDYKWDEYPWEKKASQPTRKGGRAA
jgi:uncharacterized protein